MASGAARALLLGGLSMLLGWYVIGGEIHFYVNERSAWLVALAVPLLAALAVSHAHGGGRADGAGLLALALPLAVALLVPARPLGSAVVDQQARAPVSAVQSALPLDLPPIVRLGGEGLTWDLRQLEALRVRDPEMRGLAGAKASLLGFVYRPPGLPPDQFFVARFMVRCCAADATAVRVPIRYDGAAGLAPDTWVEVDGTIDYGRTPDGPGPLVEASSVRSVPQPNRPYLYP